MKLEIDSRVEYDKYYLFTVTVNSDQDIISLYQDKKLMTRTRMKVNYFPYYYIGIADKDNLMKSGALNGVINEIRIYNKKLTRKDIDDIHQSYN